MPVVWSLTGEKGYASLISMGSVQAEDIEIKGRARMGALPICLEGNTGFGSNAEIDSLVIKAVAELGKSAVASVLNVISS